MKHLLPTARETGCSIRHKTFALVKENVVDQLFVYCSHFFKCFYLTEEFYVELTQTHCKLSDI